MNTNVKFEPQVGKPTQETEETSSTMVKTPLVDALRSYFERTKEVPVETMYEWGTRLGVV